jgi:hypothetical protein
VERNEYETKVLEMLGDPKKVDRELRAFGKDARILSSKRKHLLQQYPQQWIAIYDGEVAAQARTLPVLVETLRRLGIPRGRAIVRYINNNPRKMIL